MPGNFQFVDPKPLMEALEYADRALGFDAWDLMKEWNRTGRLRMRGKADGVTKDFDPHWFDFLVSWGLDEPVPAGAPDQLGGVPSVGPGRSSDRPRRTTLDDSQIDKTKLVTRPRLTSPDDILYFDRPTRKQVAEGVTVPVRVSGVMVEMVELRRLIDVWKSSSATADGAAEGVASPEPVRADAADPVLPRETKSHFAGIPPDWIGLPDVMPTLKQHFGVDFTKWARDLKSRIQKGQVQHRIAGLGLGDLHLRATDRIFGVPRIRGLKYDSEERTVIVDDWDEAEVDWPAGTVAGALLGDGGRRQHRIELWWLDLETWATTRVQNEHEASACSARLDTALPQASVPKKRGGGRRPKYMWGPALAKLRERLEEDGAPASGDGGQAELEQFVASQFPPDNCPGESVTREMVRKEIDAFRRLLNNEGR